MDNLRSIRCLTGCMHSTQQQIASLTVVLLMITAGFTNAKPISSQSHRSPHKDGLASLRHSSVQGTIAKLIMADATNSITDNVPTESTENRLSTPNFDSSPEQTSSASDSLVEQSENSAATEPKASTIFKHSNSKRSISVMGFDNVDAATSALERERIRLRHEQNHKLHRGSHHGTHHRGHHHNNESHSDAHETPSSPVSREEVDAVLELLNLN